MPATELAAVLRSWRDRISPEAAGMPHGSRRQAPGLRREELATLAGISVDYLVRLEQGRASSPSPQVLGSLARALRLTTQERDHLYRLADAAIPGSTDVPSHLTPSIQRIIDRLGDTPVGVFSASWDLLSFNPLWAALLGDPSGRSGIRANLVWRYFFEEHSRVIHSATQRAAFERDIVADLRQASGRYPADRALAALIETMRDNPHFTEIWNEATVAAHVSSRKTIDVPGIGLIALDCDVLTVPDSDLRAVVYTAAPGTDDEARLDLLRVAGLQSFAPSSVS
jgi:transcriptional regulator with XRE-family HTH domain